MIPLRRIINNMCIFVTLYRVQRKPKHMRAMHFERAGRTNQRTNKHFCWVLYGKRCEPEMYAYLRHLSATASFPFVPFRFVHSVYPSFDSALDFSGRSPALYMFTRLLMMIAVLHMQASHKILRLLLLYYCC